MINLPKVSNKLSRITDPLGVMQPKKPMTSESSTVNEQHGICPKCVQQMTFAQIGSGERVYYCVRCRVAAPIQN